MGMDEKALLEERRALTEAKRDGSTQYDKWLLTLAAGSIGLSIAFLRDIAGSEPMHSWAVIVSWSFLAISIICTMISLHTSQAACQRNIEILDSRYLKDDSCKQNPFVVATFWLNISSLVAFVFGLVALAYFSFINI